MPVKHPLDARQRPPTDAPTRPEPTPGGGRGDSISGSVGEHAQGVVIGKNVFQSVVVIGTLKIPVLPVLVLILMVAGLGAFFGYRLLGPAQMSGAFNLAVADFGQEDASGRVVPSQNGRLISQRLFEGLQIELDSLSPADRANFHPQVWQDSLDITQKRVKIGIIPGHSEAQREKAACELAQKIHADMVIYGNLPEDLSQGSFIPEFAVCDNPDLRVDADEIVGAHRLVGGLALPLVAQLGQPNVDLAVNLKVNTWSRALSLFSIGIMYDLQGRPDLALGIFQQARDQMGGANEAGGEVVWFFIGREELTLADTDSAARDNHLAEAQSAFEKSLAINPQYARAHIGLGSVSFDRAQHTPGDQRLQTPDLASAIQEYQAALSGAGSSAGALIEPKARLGLGAAWILEGEAYRDASRLPEAGDAFSNAAQAAQETIPSLAAAGQFRILAQAYLTLGEAYHEQGHLKLQEGDPSASRDFFQKASDSYSQCIQQKDAAITDQTLANQIVDGLCVPYKQMVDASLADLGK